MPDGGESGGLDESFCNILLVWVKISRGCDIQIRVERFASTMAFMTDILPSELGFVNTALKAGGVRWLRDIQATLQTWWGEPI